MIQETLDKLYKKYEYPRFVPCGLVDEKSYKTSRTKVLWLLKEPNDQDENDQGKDWEKWTLIEYLNYCINNDKINKMWKVVGGLTFGLQQEKFPTFRESFNYYDPKAPNICKGLKAIAVTNLKKIGGGGSSKQDEIIIAAKDDKDLWSEEIRIMAPDLVICGGTYFNINNPLKLSEQNIQAGSIYATHDFGGHKCILLHMCHPAYRVSPALLYAFFKDCIEELRMNGKLP